MTIFCFPFPGFFLLKKGTAKLADIFFKNTLKLIICLIIFQGFHDGVVKLKLQVSELALIPVLLFVITTKLTEFF